MKEMLRFNNRITLLAAILLLSCSFGEYRLATDYNDAGSSEYNLYTIPEQKAPASYIKSIQFHKSGSPQAPPILRLGTSETLSLSFDALKSEGQQFRMEVSHRDPDWSESILPPELVVRGIRSAYITGGIRSRFRDVSYYHYSTRFPVQSFEFLVSGNYLLHVYDDLTNQEVFSLPFFIHENEGRISSTAEVVFNNNRSRRAEEQLFTTYNYPSFVQFPQFDLSFRFAQNKLWGNTKEPDIFDASVEGEVEFHLSRDQMYKADFEFNTVDLNELRNHNRFLDFNPSSDPQKVVLREDVQNFAAAPIPVRQSRFGSVNNDRSSRYISTDFSLIPRRTLDPSTNIYLTGDFNQWQIQSSFKLEYDEASGQWKVNALIKQGFYAYKYVILEGTEITAIEVDDAFTRQQQEYSSFVYYLDPARRYYRLLQAQVFTGR